MFGLPDRAWNLDLPSPERSDIEMPKALEGKGLRRSVTARAASAWALEPVSVNRICGASCDQRILSEASFQNARSPLELRCGLAHNEDRFHA